MQNHFDIEHFSEIQRYLNKTYVNSITIEPFAFIYINIAFKNELLELRIQKQVSNKLIIYYFNNVEVLVKSKITKETPAIVICLESELAWIKKFTENQSDKIINYTSFVKQTLTQEIFTVINKAYTDYKNSINSIKSKQNKAEVKQTKKRTLYFYYTKENEQFYLFLKLKINTNHQRFSNIAAYCYKSIEDLLIEIKKAKRSDYRIIISNSKDQPSLKEKIPTKINYKILVYDNKKIQNKKEVQVDNSDPYQKMLASNVISLMVSSQIEEESLLAIYNILSNVPKIIIAEFDKISNQVEEQGKPKKKEVSNSVLEQLLIKQTQNQFSLIIIQQYQREGIIDLINRHNFSNILIIEHFMECLYINCQQSMIIFQYCQLHEFTVFLAEFKQNILISADSIFGTHIKTLNLFIFKNHPIYFTLLQNCNNNILPNVRLVKFEDQFHLKSLISENQSMNIANLILCAQNELLSLIKNNIITSNTVDSNLKLIVYPTKLNLDQFKNNLVVLATSDQQEIVNFIKGFQKHAQIEPQEYEKSMIQSNIKIKLKTIKKTENEKQRFILPQEGRPKIFIHIPKNLKGSESKIFKNRVYKIFKTDLVFEEYEKIQDVIFFNFAQQPLSYTIIQQQNLEWGINFAKTCLQQHCFRLIIFSSTQNLKTNNLSRIKLVTTKFKEIEKYIIEDVKKYQKKYLLLIKNIYTQFVEGCKQDNPVHVMYTMDKKLNFAIKNNKLVNIQSYANYDEIIKLTLNPNRKNIIIIDTDEQEKIQQKFQTLKISNYFLLVVGGNFITKQDDKVIFRTKGYKQMQHFIKKVILRQEIVEVKSYINVYQKWNLMKKKILVYYPTNYLKFNKVLSSSYVEEIHFQQYTKIQDLKTQFIELYPTFYVVLKMNADLEKNSKFLEEIILPSIQNTSKMYQIHEIQNQNKPKSKNAYFVYTNIQELKKMIQNITQKKKREIITKITKRYNQPIVLHKQTFYSEHNKVIYLRYTNNDELFRIITQMKLNRFFLSYLMITVTEDEYKKIKAAAEGMDKIIFIVICESKFKNFNEISMNDNNIIFFFDNDSAQDFVMKLPQNMESRKKKLSIMIEDLDFLKKLQKTLKKRISKCSTEIQLSQLTNTLPQKVQNQYMFIVSKQTFLNLKQSKKGKFNELFYFILKSKEVVNDPIILFNSNDENELLNFLGNLQKTQKIPFVDFQEQLIIYSDISFKDKNLHKTIHSVQYYSECNQLITLLKSKKSTPPILILKQSTDSLLIETSSQVYRMIYCSSDIRKSRPLFELPETFLVANEFQSITKYINLLAPEQKIVMYCSNSLFKYRRNKIPESKIQYLQYKVIADITKFLKPKSQKRTIFQVLCEEPALQQIQKYIEEYQKKYPKNKYRAVVVVAYHELQNKNSYPKYIFKDNLIKLYDFVSDKAESIHNQTQKSPSSPTQNNNQLESSQIIFNKINFENNFKMQKVETNKDNNNASIAKNTYYEFGKPEFINQSNIFKIQKGNFSIGNNSPISTDTYYEFGKLEDSNGQNNLRPLKLDISKVNISPIQKNNYYDFGKSENTKVAKLVKMQKNDLNNNSQKLLKRGLYQFGTFTPDPKNSIATNNFIRQQKKINQFTVKIQQTLNNQTNHLIYSIGQASKPLVEEFQSSKSEAKTIEQKKSEIKKYKQKNRKSNLDPELQFYGFESFVKRSESRKDMNLVNQLREKKYTRCLTLILDITKKETKGVSMSYKNIYQNARVLKFQSKDQLLIKLKELGKDDGIIVLNADNQNWLVGFEQRPNHKFIIVGQAKPSSENKIYLKDFRNLMQELTSLNQSKNIRKRSLSNSLSKKNQRSMSKNKITIKKVRDAKNVLLQYGPASDPSTINVTNTNDESLRNEYQMTMSIPNNNTILQHSYETEDSIRYRNKFNQSIKTFNNK